MNGVKAIPCLPYFCRGPVIKGFGRGSKELGIPTANFPEDIVEKLPSTIPPGVYYGWSQVGRGDVHKMVMSIGWNPYYHNTKKSMETHILHKFDSDFYGSELGIMILGFIRPELNFRSLDELVEAIESDIKIAHSQLDKSDARTFLAHTFFTEYGSTSHMNGTHSNL